MPIYWLIIFFTLINFIPINSKPANYADNKSRISDHRNRLNMSINSTINDLEAPIKIEETLHNQNKRKIRRTEEELSSKKEDYLRAIAALSKIAKVQQFDENSTVIREDLITHTDNDTEKKSGYSANDTAPWMITEIPFTDVSLEPLFNGKIDNDGIKQENFQCEPTESVYIPEIKEFVPSYMCKFGIKMFMLSSKGFFEDLKGNLSIKVDEDMLRKIGNFSVTSGKKQLQIIPAILSIKQDHKDYNIGSRLKRFYKQVVDNKNE